MRLRGSKLHPASQSTIIYIDEFKFTLRLVARTRHGAPHSFAEARQAQEARTHRLPRRPVKGPCFDTASTQPRTVGDVPTARREALGSIQPKIVLLRNHLTELRLTQPIRAVGAIAVTASAVTFGFVSRRRDLWSPHLPLKRCSRH